MARKNNVVLPESVIVELAESAGMSVEQYKAFVEKLEASKTKIAAVEAEENAKKKAELEAAAKQKAIDDENELNRIATLINVAKPSSAKRFHVTEIDIKEDGNVVGTKTTNVKLYYSSESFSKELKALIKTGEDRTPEQIIEQVENAKKELLMDLVKISM